MTITLSLQGSSLFPKNTLLSLSQEHLLLMHMSWLHVGNYTCVATNNEGSTQTTATISLRGMYCSNLPCSYSL